MTMLLAFYPAANSYAVQDTVLWQQAYCAQRGPLTCAVREIQEVGEAYITCTCSACGSLTGPKCINGCVQENGPAVSAVLLTTVISTRPGIFSRSGLNVHLWESPFCSVGRISNGQV